MATEFICFAYLSSFRLGFLTGLSQVHSMTGFPWTSDWLHFRQVSNGTLVYDDFYMR